MSLRSFALVSALVVGSLLAPRLALAGQPKTYQVTGPVLEVSDEIIVVQKGKEKWEIARGPDKKVSGGELKVGAKVTIEYRMTAASIEVKGDAKGGKADEAKGDKKK